MTGYRDLPLPRLRLKSLSATQARYQTHEKPSEVRYVKFHDERDNLIFSRSFS